MPVSKRTVLCFAAALFFTLECVSCTFNPPSQINVACDVNDLIQAIHTANSNSDTTTIILDANCTYPFITADNQDGGEGPNALPIITTKITIEGNNAILLRSGSDDFRFFFITDSGNLNLLDVTLDNGHVVAISNDQPWPRGGAIYNDNGGLTAERTVFQNNQAVGGHGGAVYNRGVFYMDDNCQFLHNHAERGGAIYNTGANDTPFTLYNSTLTSNTADIGAALYNVGPETNILLGTVTMDANWAVYDGGAIYMDGGQMRISTSRIYANHAVYQSAAIGRGGAIFKADGRLSISDTEIFFNVANQQGGGIYHGGGLLTLDNCLLYNNYLRYISSASSAYGSGLGDGGGIYNLGDLEIESSTLKSNRTAMDLGTASPSSGGNGGAIYNGGSVSLMNSSLYRNVAIEGAAIYNTYNLKALNCTFVLNEAQVAGSGIFNQGGTVAVDFATFYDNEGLSAQSVIQQESGTFAINNSLLSDNLPDNCLIQGGTFTAVGDNLSNDLTCPGFTVLITGNLQSGGYWDYGGPTWTVSILATSAAYNHATCFTSVAVPVARDQRGVYRPQPGGGSCDIGAFELEVLGDAPISPMPTQAVPEPRACAPQNTTCREGDSSEYEALGYLLEGECADVVGRNEDATWLVIINPDWEGECWVLRDLVETEGDVDGTEVRYAPALPTKTPTEQLGCWVQDTRGGDPVCTVPCPAGADPGTPCTP